MKAGSGRDKPHKCTGKNKQKAVIAFYREILELFVSSKIEFVLIGGFAVNAHGFQRTTGDMDLLLSPTQKNIESAAKCINDLGFDGIIAGKVLSEPNGMLFLKEEPYRVDLLTKINLPDSFQAIFERAEVRSLFGIEIRVIGYTDLINEKARSKRDKDLQDIYELEEIRRSRN